MISGSWFDDGWPCHYRLKVFGEEKKKKERRSRQGSPEEHMSGRDVQTSHLRASSDDHLTLPAAVASYEREEKTTDHDHSIDR